MYGIASWMLPNERIKKDYPLGFVPHFEKGGLGGI
jgi:hypothetical protein